MSRLGSGRWIGYRLYSNGGTVERLSQFVAAVTILSRRLWAWFLQVRDLDGGAGDEGAYGGGVQLFGGRATGGPLLSWSGLPARRLLPSSSAPRDSMVRAS